MSLLFSFRPLVINPELARRIGLNEAIVLQQMNYWLMETDSGVTHDGRRWIYNTHEQWNDQFPFWSQDTVKRAITSLKKQGILRVEKLNKGRCDHTNFYTINYDSAALIEQCNMPSSNGSKLPSSEDDGLPSPNSANCPHLTESTTDTTTENTTDIYSEADESASVASGEAVPAVLSNGQQDDQSETVFQSKCRLLWTMYKAAFKNRYGIDPVRNAKVNTQVKQIVQRLGEEGAMVAEFYVYQVNERFVVQKTHDLGLLLKDAESYRTQWAMGRAMTQTRAQQIDSTQANASAADEAIAMLRAREQGAYHP